MVPGFFFFLKIQFFLLIVSNLVKLLHFFHNYQSFNSSSKSSA